MSKSLAFTKLAFNRQGGKCFYCGLRMWLNSQKGPSLLRCTAEHLKARSEGGSDGPSNIVAACWHCNHTRHKCKHPLDPPKLPGQGRALPRPRCLVPRPCPDLGECAGLIQGHAKRAIAGEAESQPIGNRTHTSTHLMKSSPPH